MHGAGLDSTVIFLSWDDWGGFYDQLWCPRRLPKRLRLRVARHGDQPIRQKRLIDHQASARMLMSSSWKTCSWAAAHRTRPRMGGLTRRPDVRENMPQLGDLILDFNFKTSLPAAAGAANQPSAGPGIYPISQGKTKK